MSELLPAGVTTWTALERSERLGEQYEYRTLSGVSMTIVATTTQVTDIQLGRYAKLIYDRTGIKISPQKKTLLSNRLRRRMKATGIDCFDKYYQHLRKLREDDLEWDLFLEEITTHETYLFRDEAQWEWFCDSYLPALQAAARKGERKKTLRIWSAACSTGDEAYTIASCVADKLASGSQWKVEIVGTDIGVGALEKAKKAIFGPRAMKLVPDSYRKRFFSQVEDDHWAAKPVLTAMTSFHQHNLMDPMRGPQFDLVILKNVLIYFDPKSKKQVFGHINEAVCSGGMLITGPAEGIADLLNHHERQRPWLHRKP